MKRPLLASAAALMLIAPAGMAIAQDTSAPPVTTTTTTTTDTQADIGTTMPADTMPAETMPAEPAPTDTMTDDSMTGDANMATTTMPMNTGTMQFVRREMAQPAAGSADAAALQSGDLPVCKKGQQDGCINGWEKNRSGNRPLNYWPGKPASEMPGKKPQG